MSKLLSPYGAPPLRFTDANGNPLNGGLIETYLAGTTTPKATYKNRSGAALHANPIVLLSDGWVPGGAIWLDTDEPGYKFVLKTSAGVTLLTVDEIRPLAEPGEALQSAWLSGPAPTFIDADEFSVEGDQRGLLHVNRRLRLDDATMLYGTITASAYDGDNNITEVTLLLDSGSLSASLTALAYSLLSAVDDAIPRPGGPADVGTLQTDVGALQTDVGALQTDVGALQAARGPITLQSITAASQATVEFDFTALLTARGLSLADVARFEVLGGGIAPATDAESLNVQVAIGGTYLTADYRYTSTGRTSAGADASSQAVGAASMLIASAVGSGATENVGLTLNILGPGSTTKHKCLSWHAVESRSNDNSAHFVGGGQYIGGVGALSGVRFLFNAGANEIAVGEFTLIAHLRAA